MKKSPEDVIKSLKSKINANNKDIEETDKKHREQNELYVEATNTINDLDAKLRKATAQLDAFNKQVGNPGSTLSTTQFFNPSLALNEYNMNGNSLATNSYMAVRQMVGIINNNTPNVLQSIPGINGSNANGSTPNGSAVGLTAKNGGLAGWWFWIMILHRIQYFANNFSIKCSDRKLKKAIEEYLTSVVWSGWATIEKVKDNYRVMCATNIKMNEFGEPESWDAYNRAYMWNNLQTNPDKDTLAKNIKMNDNMVLGQWRSNGYNVWFYVVAYLMNSVDLLYLYWNKARLNKTVILQIKGNSSEAMVEAQNFLNPYQNVVTVNSVGWLNDEGEKSGRVSLENKYDIKDLSKGEETQYAFSNFQTWTNWWDKEIGIRSAPVNLNTSRSITDEIVPLTVEIFKQQQDFINCFEDFLAQIKEKWGVEVTYDFLDNIMIENLNPATVASKGEGGNETEQKHNNGTAGETGGTE